MFFRIGDEAGTGRLPAESLSVSAPDAGLSGRGQNMPSQPKWYALIERRSKAGLLRHCRIGMPAMRCCHSAGPVWWTLVPLESTATVTGMSLTSNS